MDFAAIKAGTPVPPKSLDMAMEFVNGGFGFLYVSTYARVTLLDKKTFAKWAKAGIPLLWERDDGYQMASGRKSVYVVPGLLRFGKYEGGE